MRTARSNNRTAVAGCSDASAVFARASSVCAPLLRGGAMAGALGLPGFRVSGSGRPIDCGAAVLSDAPDGVFGLRCSRNRLARKPRAHVPVDFSSFQRGADSRLHR